MLLFIAIFLFLIFLHENVRFFFSLSLWGQGGVSDVVGRRVSGFFFLPIIVLIMFDRSQSM